MHNLNLVGYAHSRGRRYDVDDEDDDDDDDDDSKQRWVNWIGWNWVTLLGEQDDHLLGKFRKFQLLFFYADMLRLMNFWQLNFRDGLKFVYQLLVWGETAQLGEQFQCNLQYRKPKGEMNRIKRFRTSVSS